MNFFKDGGTKVITPEDNFRENNSAIADFLMDNNTIDFILLQETDRKSKIRSDILNLWSAKKKSCMKIRENI